MFQNLIDIIAAPSAAFARLKQQPTVLFPLLLVLLAATSVQVGYILLTDRGFLIDQQMEQVQGMFANMSDEQIEQMRQNALNTSTTALILNAGISTLVISLVIMALYALYLRFVSRFTFVELGWKAWLSLLSWTSVPLVFGALASWVVMLTNGNGQVPMLDLNPLSLSNLLGLGITAGPLALIGPLYVWHFVLLALGYQHWTNKGLVSSALISLVPYLLIFGVWGFLSL